MSVVFAPLTKRTARWRGLGESGLEHLTLEHHNGRISATGILAGRSGESAFGLWYQMFFDHDWQIRALSIHRTDARWLIIKSPRPGLWRDGDGRALDALDGCLDAHMSATAFTSTAPVRRCAALKGASLETEAVSVDADTLTMSPARQRYTCLEPMKRYRHENLDDGFSADIDVDHDGLAIYCAGLYEIVL